MVEEEGITVLLLEDWFEELESLGMVQRVKSLLKIQVKLLHALDGSSAIELSHFEDEVEETRGPVAVDHVIFVKVEECFAEAVEVLLELAVKLKRILREKAIKMQFLGDNVKDGESVSLLEVMNNMGELRLRLLVLSSDEEKLSEVEAMLKVFVVELSLLVRLLVRKKGPK